jgi:hypothetical protein
MEELRKGYRVPELREFVFGFRYEVLSEGYWEDSSESFWGWYCYIWGNGNYWRDIDDIKRELEYGNIRVLIV